MAKTTAKKTKKANGLTLSQWAEFKSLLDRLARGMHKHQVRRLVLKLYGAGDYDVDVDVDLQQGKPYNRPTVEAANE